MRRLRVFLLFLTVVVVIVATCSLRVWHAKQQAARCRQLIVALEHNDVRQALELVNAGADPNTHCEPPPEPSLELWLDELLHRPYPTIDHFSTAFILACGAGCDVPNNGCVGRYQYPEDVQLVQVMLAHGADPNAHVQIGGPVMNIAVSLNHARVVELLLAHGAKVNYYGGGAGTPLMSAIKNNNPYLVRLLLAHGADVNMKNWLKDTPLSSAVMGAANTDIIEQRLTYGADVAQRDGFGETSLMYAQQRKRPDLVALLKRGGK